MNTAAEQLILDMLSLSVIIAILLFTQNVIKGPNFSKFLTCGSVRNAKLIEKFAIIHLPHGWKMIMTMIIMKTVTMQ